MTLPQHRGESEHLYDESGYAPSSSIWLDVWRQEGAGIPPERCFVAALRGLQALKCSGVQGYGSTEEEAVINLRRKVLQFLEFQPG